MPSARYSTTTATNETQTPVLAVAASSTFMIP